MLEMADPRNGSAKWETVTGLTIPEGAWTSLEAGCPKKAADGRP